jgi:hypothetical protein
MGETDDAVRVRDARRTVAEASAAHGIALGPAEDAWTVRGVPLAPFPARLRIDAAQATLWHDVVAAEVVPPVAVEAIVAGIALPRPEVRLMVGEARWLVALSYPLPLDRVTPSEVVGLLAAGALYADTLAKELTGHLGKRWRATLEEHGLLPAAAARPASGAGLGSGAGPAGARPPTPPEGPRDPRDLLRRGTIVAWPDIGR